MDAELLYLLSLQTSNPYTLNNNMVINGAMEINQRNITSYGPPTTTASTYVSSSGALPGSINVASNVGFPSTGTLICTAQSPASGYTNYVVTYGGKSGTTQFTTCTTATYTTPTFSTNNPVISASPYTLDRWKVNYPGTGNGVLTTSQVSMPSSSSSPPFNYYMSVNTTTADTTADPYSQYTISQTIEAGNIAQLAYGTSSALPTVLSFWVNSSVTGTYSVAIQTYSFVWEYITTYTISVANTWQKISILIPPLPTPPSGTGSWSSNTNIGSSGGATVVFDLGSGSSNQVSSSFQNAWYYYGTTSSITAVQGQTSFASTLNSTFYLTGVQWSTGTITPTSFTRAGITEQGELAACQRYYYRFSTTSSSNYERIAIGMADNTNWQAMIHFPVTMRQPPTMTTSQTVGQFYVFDLANLFALTSIWHDNSTPYDSNLSGFCAGNMGISAAELLGSPSTTPWIEWNAEL
jgi:hypothetical protein